LEKCGRIFFGCPLGDFLLMDRRIPMVDVNPAGAPI